MRQNKTYSDVWHANKNMLQIRELARAPSFQILGRKVIEKNEFIFLIYTTKVLNIASLQNGNFAL